MSTYDSPSPVFFSCVSLGICDLPLTALCVNVSNVIPKHACIRLRRCIQIPTPSVTHFWRFTRTNSHAVKRRSIRWLDDLCASLLTFSRQILIFVSEGVFIVNHGSYASTYNKYIFRLCECLLLWQYHIRLNICLSYFGSLGYSFQQKHETCICLSLQNYVTLRGTFLSIQPYLMCLYNVLGINE
jgi:hypothetical protein